MDNIFGAGGVGGDVGRGVREWFLSLPPVTRAWLGCTVVVTASVHLDLVASVGLDLGRGGWDDVLGRGVSGRVEVWRVLTCFLYAGKLSFGTMIGVHMMTQTSGRYERMGPICTRIRHVDPDRPSPARQMEWMRRNDNRNMISPYYPRGETSDYVFALLFGVAGILLTNFALLPMLPSSITHGVTHRFFHRHLSFYVTYVWSRRHPDVRVNLFGVAMSASLLPCAYLVLGYAMNGGTAVPLDMLNGMFVGHLYYYLACVVPTVLGGGRTVLRTPMALVDWCNWLEGRDVEANGGGAGGGGGGNGGPALADLDGVIGG